MESVSTRSRFDEGVRLATGDGVPRDLAAARWEFTVAANEGDAAAARALAGFMAGGIGGARHWDVAVDLLRSWAQRDVFAAAQYELISAMDLTADGDPVSIPAPKPLHATKQIALFERLLAPAECAYLAQIAEPSLRPAEVITSADGVKSKPDVRDNDHSGFEMLKEPPFVRAINRRIAAASGTDVRQGEPLQIMRYRPGQQYRTHLDRIGEGTNQRLMTAIVYLNDNYSGGETRFPALDLDVRGKQGDMLLFRNLTDEGEVDTEMRHAGLPTSAGVKYIASRWILQRPAYDELGNMLGETLWS
jgi:prolyl 4-hydroxylase